MIYAIAASYVKEQGTRRLDWPSTHSTAESVVMYPAISMSFSSKSELELMSSKYSHNCTRVAPVSLGVCDEQVFTTDSEGRLTSSKR